MTAAAKEKPVVKPEKDLSGSAVLVAAESEVALVGAVLQDPDAVFPLLADRVKVEHLSQEDCRLVWGRVLALFRAHQDDRGWQADFSVVLGALAEHGELERVGGAGRLAEMIERAAVPSMVDKHAGLVIEKWKRREVARLSGVVTGLVSDPNVSTDEVLAEVQDHVIQATAAGEQRAAVSTRELVMDVVRDIDEVNRMRGRVTRGVPTGFVKIDRCLMGIPETALVVLAARPSQGKSALVMNMAENAARAGHSVLCFNLEMENLDVGRRMVMGRAGVDLIRMRDGFFGKSDLQKIRESAAEIAKLPLCIHDDTGLSINDIRARVRAHHFRNPLGLVVVDYLQLVHGVSKASRENETMRVTEVSNGLKAMAKELRVPVIATAQLNRDAEASRSGKPKLSHLKQSGSIEQDADIVMLLHRPAYYDKEADPSLAIVDIAKQRNGPVGEQEIRFIGNLARFDNEEGERMYG